MAKPAKGQGIKIAAAHIDGQGVAKHMAPLGADSFFPKNSDNIPQHELERMARLRKKLELLQEMRQLQRDLGLDSVEDAVEMMLANQ